MPSLLEMLIARKPVLIALLIIALCLLLLRPRKKRVANAQGSAAQPARSAAKPKRSLSISTVRTLLRFEGGVPRVNPDAAEALLRLAERADVYLVTQLERDSDEQEQAVMAALDVAGIFGAGRRARRATPPSAPPADRLARPSAQVRPAQGAVLHHGGRQGRDRQAALAGRARRHERKGAPTSPPAARATRRPTARSRTSQIVNYLRPHVPLVVLVAGPDPPANILGVPSLAEFAASWEA